MPTFIKNHKKTAVIMGCTVVLIAILFYVFIVLNGDHTPGDAEKPTLAVQTPRKLSLSATDTVTVDVTISALGEALYPAASMNIAFDASRLEFLGVEEGNVFIKSDNSSGQSLPEWSYNTAACNESGRVNVMYLDMTGGKNAYSKELLNEDYNVVIRLKFRLRGSVRAGDVCDLVVEDAVFAASDETQSLAMITNTLSVVNGKIVIGE